MIPDGSESEHRDTPRVYESMLQENWYLKRTWIQIILRNEPCCTISRPCVGCVNQCRDRLSENRFLFQSWTSPCARHFWNPLPAFIRQWAIVTIERGRCGVSGIHPRHVSESASIRAHNLHMNGFISNESRLVQLTIAIH